MGLTSLAYQTGAVSPAQHLPNYPWLLSQALIGRGISEHDLFRGMEFGLADLTDKRFRLSASQHERFIKQAISLANDPHLAFTISSRVSDASYSAFLMALANSGRVSKALHLFTRYNRIFTRTLTVRPLDIEGGSVLDVVPHLTDRSVTYFAISSLTFFLDSFFREPLGGAHLVRRAEFALPEPDGFDRISDQIGFPITFGHDRTRIHLDSALLDVPLRQADPATVRLMTEWCERQLQEADAETDIVAAVTSLLLDHIASPPRHDQVAAMLHMSARSLRRKLQVSGTTFQDILDGVRLRLASKLLRETDEAISSIAYEIGFDSPSHFGRAFRRWTGKSPTDFRNQ